MDKLGLLNRFLLGHAFTILMNLATLAIIVPVTFNEVKMLREGSELLHAFESQSVVGVLLVALGVVLEGRHTFVLRVMKLYKVDHLPGQDEFSDTCEIYGFYVLVLGLLIESFGEMVKLFGIQHHLALLGFSGLSIALNIISCVVILQLCVKVFRIRLTES